jgi:hypothetical protein
MTETAWTKTKIDFIFNHRHVNSPENYKHLENLHRHFLVVDVWVEEFGTENDFTPEALTDWLNQIIPDLTVNETSSLPMIAKLIKMNIDKLYLGNRKVRINIQDGEGIGHYFEW